MSRNFLEYPLGLFAKSDDGRIVIVRFGLADPVHLFDNLLWSVILLHQGLKCFRSHAFIDTVGTKQNAVARFYGKLHDIRIGLYRIVREETTVYHLLTEAVLRVVTCLKQESAVFSEKVTSAVAYVYHCELFLFDAGHD